jgi:hypothetical protein
MAWRRSVASVRGLLEEREAAARVAVEELRVEADRVLAALGEAETLLERRSIAVEELAEALSVAGEAVVAPVADVPDVPPAPPVVVKGPVARSVVPRRGPGTEPQVLAPEYRQILELLQSGAGLGEEGMQAKEMAARLGLELTAAKIEGVRSRAKRLSERGWVEQMPSGRFRPRASSAPAARVAG